MILPDFGEPQPFNAEIGSDELADQQPPRGRGVIGPSIVVPESQVSVGNEIEYSQKHGVNP